MGKNTKTIGLLLIVLGIACFAMYFVMGDKYNNYKVIFDSDGGSIVAEQEIKKGEKATKPADPTKENYEFLEWRLNGTAYNFDNVVSDNITLKAIWNQIINHNIKVTLDGNEYTATVREGNLLTPDILNIPAKEGYKVKLYNENNEEFDLNSGVQADLVLTAKYIEIKYYTVKFNSNGGTKVADLKVEEGTQAAEPTVTKDGFILDGWYIGETKFDFTTPINKDITLKARWNDGPKINVIFMVDGTVYKTIPVSENTAVTKPANPTKKGYVFKEWQLNGSAFDFKTKITMETTLTAIFEEKSTYTVTFNSDGGSSVKSQEVTDKVTKPTDPTKKGYVFLEWQLNGKKFDFDKTTVTEDITLKAIWEKEKAKFKVTFNNDDGSLISTQTVVDGEKATKPVDPTKTGGYRFVDWLYNHATYNFDTPVTKDIILTAHYEKITEQNAGDQVSDDVADLIGQ